MGSPPSWLPYRLLFVSLSQTQTAKSRDPHLSSSSRLISCCSSNRFRRSRINLLVFWHLASAHDFATGRYLKGSRGRPRATAGRRSAAFSSLCLHQSIRVLFQRQLSPLLRGQFRFALFLRTLQSRRRWQRLLLLRLFRSSGGEIAAL